VTLLSVARSSKPKAPTEPVYGPRRVASLLDFAAADRPVVAYRPRHEVSSAADAPSVGGVGGVVVGETGADRHPERRLGRLRLLPGGLAVVGRRPRQVLQFPRDVVESQSNSPQGYGTSQSPRSSVSASRAASRAASDGAVFR
jgi:hypothetical protein